VLLAAHVARRSSPRALYHQSLKPNEDSLRKGKHSAEDCRVFAASSVNASSVIDLLLRSGVRSTVGDATVLNGLIPCSFAAQRQDAGFFHKQGLRDC
jgi:hypothetical protein